MMDFAMLPPEINSGRMYSGPGSGPMLAAAAAWDGLAAELHSTAASYGSVISALAGGPWLGPTSASMAAAVSPYLAWMSATGARAEQAANQARAAATAYETAFALTVPPPVIAANRAALAALTATNFLGQNTPAIAATEAHYADMWAQDAAAMYDYAGSSAAASTLTPFGPPPATTNPAGTAAQAGAVVQTAGTSAGVHLQNIVSAVPHALQGLATPAASDTSASGLSGILGGLGASVSPLSVLTTLPATVDIPAATAAVGASSTSASASFTSVGYSSRGMALTEELAADEAAQGAIRGGAMGPAVGLGSTDSGARGAGATPPGMGLASSVGGLSTPQSWVRAAPATRLVAAQLPNTGLAAAPAVEEAGTGSLFSEMALAGMSGRALAGTAGVGRRPERISAGTGTRAQQRHRPAGGSLAGIAADLRELADLRGAGVLTDEEFATLKRRLLGA